MTTPRTRRNAMKQAEDALEKLLVKQEAVVTKLKVQFDAAKAEALATRRAFATLHQVVLPGMEALPNHLEYYDPDASKRDVNLRSVQSEPPPLTPAQKAIGAAMAESVVKDLDRRVEAMAEPVSRPHRQRIGEKAQHISDVWNDKDGSFTVHTALMYSRQDRCEWCLKGMPFATEQRMEHYVVTTDDKGVERGFSYEPCKGIKRFFDVATKDFGKGDA